MVEVKEKKIKIELDPEKMLEAGLHFGHRTSNCHPGMKPYIFGSRNTVHIIDLDKTAEMFKKALEFVSELISSGGVLMIIGTKIQVKGLVKELAEELKLPYVNERWLGGTFTNFKSIRKRVEYFKDLERKKTEGELEKYTKKEKAEFDQELSKLQLKFGGIKDMDKLPEAIFVLDMRKDDLAVKEARMKGVKILGLCDTNIDPCLADYPIPANDDAISSVKYILDNLKEIIIKSKPKK